MQRQDLTPLQYRAIHEQTMSNEDIFEGVPVLPSSLFPSYISNDNKNQIPPHHHHHQLIQASSVAVSKLDASLFEYNDDTYFQSQEEDYELELSLPFPIKLHYILSSPKFQDCITWLPHGRAWKVLDQHVLEKRVIPLFFRSDKYASFMRQVNGWAFTRVADGPDANSYYHDVSSSSQVSSKAKKKFYLSSF